MLNPQKENPTYTKFLTVFQRCDDAIEGQDAIKARGETYLPKLPGMLRHPNGNELYNVYLSSALWDPFSGRSFRAYLGMMTRKPAAKNLNGVEFADVDFTADGLSIDQAARELAGTVIRNFVGGILIDFPLVDTTDMTVADAEVLEVRPYAVLYTGRQIVNYEYKTFSGLKVLSGVVLEEFAPAESYDTEKVYTDTDGNATIRRHLYLSDEGAYTAETWVKTENAKDPWKLYDTATPMMRGQTMNYIPFVPCSEAGKILKYDYPLINDVVNLNLADYRNEALYRDALLFNGRPQVCVSGMIKQASGQAVSMGSGAVWEFESDGKWGTIGGGADTAALKDAAAELKRRAASIGSRALASDPNGVESAETAAIHRAGEMGILSNVSSAVSESITYALQIMAEWVGVPDDEQEYTLSTDYLPYNIDASLLSTIWQMYVRGDISFDTLWYNLTRGEIAPDGWTKDDEIEARNADRMVRDDLMPMVEKTTPDGTETVPVGGGDVGAVGEETNTVTLNGAQVTAATAIVKSVVMGEMPRDAGLGQLKILFNLDDQKANEMMGSAGK